MVLQIKRTPEEADHGQKKKQKMLLDAAKKKLEAKHAELTKLRQKSQNALATSKAKLAAEQQNIKDLSLSHKQALKDLKEVLSKFKPLFMPKVARITWSRSTIADLINKLGEKLAKIVTAYARLEQFEDHFDAFRDISEKWSADDLKEASVLLTSWLNLKNESSYNKDHIACYAALLPTVAKMANLPGTHTEEDISMSSARLDRSARLMTKHDEFVLEALDNISKADLANLVQRAPDLKRIDAHCTANQITLDQLLKPASLRNAERQHQHMEQSPSPTDHEAQIANMKAEAQTLTQGWRQAANVATQLVSVLCTYKSKTGFIFTLICTHSLQHCDKMELWYKSQQQNDWHDIALPLRSISGFSCWNVTFKQLKEKIGCWKKLRALCNKW